MKVSNIQKAQGHWLLAKMGKRVLRPGGKELSMKLIDDLSISQKDDLVEFAPGMGKTAAVLIEMQPKTYTGVDADQEVVSRLKERLGNEKCQFVNAQASETGLKSNSVDKVIGEAMLTMHADHRKSEIIKEAKRILRTGGLYGIHELALKPDNLPEEVKAEIDRELALSIKVNARPLTLAEWKELLKAEGFKIKTMTVNEMLLLEPGRVLDDEGWLRALKIGFNILTHPDAKKRIMHMRSVFRKHQRHLCSVAIVAEKI